MRTLTLIMVTPLGVVINSPGHETFASLMETLNASEHVIFSFTVVSTSADVRDVDVPEFKEVANA